jgi:hypothetical protein
MTGIARIAGIIEGPANAIPVAAASAPRVSTGKSPLPAADDVELCKDREKELGLESSATALLNSVPTPEIPFSPAEDWAICAISAAKSGALSSSATISSVELAGNSGSDCSPLEAD